MSRHSLLADFLRALSVRHTDTYADKVFNAMPFKSLFGLSKALQQFGVQSQGLQLTDRSQITALPLPFIASTRDGMVIVRSVSDSRVSMQTYDGQADMTLDEFNRHWDSRVLIAAVTPRAGEHEYGVHRLADIIRVCLCYVFFAVTAALIAYLYVTNGLYHSAGLTLAIIFDIFGLWLSTMLVQKTLHISNRTADRVCGILQAGGCDSISASDASKFLGIFSWSEVGLAYFSISLLCLLIFPQFAPYLAAINVLCLPYTVWSITYQRFVAHTWCTMCVGVQITLWALFICYLTAGAFHGIFPLRIEFFVLAATYVAVLFGLTIITPRLDHATDRS